MKARSLLLIGGASVAALYLFVRERGVNAPELSRNKTFIARSDGSYANSKTDDRTLRSKEILPDSVPIRIHWRLMFPVDTPVGEFVFRDEQTFAEFLGAKNARFMKWANVNFKTQMVLISTRLSKGGGPCHSIDEVVEANEQIIAFVKTKVSRGAVTTNVVQSTSAVVVNRSDLPVRFSDYEEYAGY